MMRSLLLMLPAAAILAACAAPLDATQMAGMPNLASQYCQEQGGRLEMREDEQGIAQGICYFPDGRVMTERDLFCYRSTQANIDTVSDCLKRQGQR